jgi:hypothetical protein
VKRSDFFDRRLPRFFWDLFLADDVNFESCSTTLRGARSLFEQRGVECSELRCDRTAYLLGHVVNDEEIWINGQRRCAEEYLRTQQVDHRGVGEYPAFHLDPYVALWAVQSKNSPGSIGWWAITGDLPTDYISSKEGRHPREALRAFARHWSEVSEFMLRGEAYPGYVIGPPDRWPELGELLRRRAEILKSYADDDELWDGS